ncbi:deoxyribonuclease V [Mucilaginibacter sp. RS28]|uniref:Endonuclease V n=1 Tax=Mucilaginibacter straminoryzae TaxID=2932774 RepID=A0A9X1X6A0_9SPHI|nr:deoxyribonuclease V [Mucilaginibacter straminoryzae]MCJ8211839.1 deoxyribonuclease V [Mucilaginibacter straminoryzae]
MTGQAYTPAEAIAYQHELRAKLNITQLDREVSVIGGADISFNKYSDVIYAAIVLFSYPDLKMIGNASVITKTDFPYIPGLLGFREVPAITEVWNKLEIKPDVMIFDGQGIAHPRRLGIATHFGIVNKVVTFGCAKSVLVGRYEEPLNEPLAWSPMYHEDEEVGAALRTKKNCKPVYISPGNGINLEQSLGIIKNCVGSYRIPEPTRQAHLLVNQIRVKDGNPPPTLFDL